MTRFLASTGVRPGASDLGLRPLLGSIKIECEEFDASSLEPSLAITMHVSYQNGHDSNILHLALSNSVSVNSDPKSSLYIYPEALMPPEVYFVT